MTNVSRDDAGTSSSTPEILWLPWYPTPGSSWHQSTAKEFLQLENNDQSLLSIVSKIINYDIGVLRIRASECSRDKQTLEYYRIQLQPAASAMLPETISGGTGSSLARATVIIAGVASLVATLLSLMYASTPAYPSYSTGKSQSLTNIRC